MEKEKEGALAPIAIKKLTGMQVYTVTEGDCLGAVKDVLLDTSRKRAAALLVEEKGRIREGRLIQFDKIQSIGDDAVIVADRGSVARASGMPNMVKILQRPATLYGTRIISTAGMSLGRLEEYHIDKTTGEICQLDLVGGRGHALNGRASLGGDCLLTIGRSAIMVDAKGAEQLLEEEESQLKQAVNDMKEKAGQAWQSTVSASKKLGQNISSSLNRLLDDKEETAEVAAKEPATPPVDQAAAEQPAPAEPPQPPVEEASPEAEDTSQAPPTADVTIEVEEVTPTPPAEDCQPDEAEPQPPEACEPPQPQEPCQAEPQPEEAIKA